MYRREEGESEDAMTRVEDGIQDVMIYDDDGDGDSGGPPSE